MEESSCIFDSLIGRAQGCLAFGAEGVIGPIGFQDEVIIGQYGWRKRSQPVFPQVEPGQLLQAFGAGWPSPQLGGFEVQGPKLGQGSNIQGLERVMGQIQLFKPRQAVELRLDNGIDDELVIAQVELRQRWQMFGGERQFGETAVADLQRLRTTECPEEAARLLG